MLRYSLLSKGRLRRQISEMLEYLIDDLSFDLIDDLFVGSYCILWQFMIDLLTNFQVWIWKTAKDMS